MEETQPPAENRVSPAGTEKRAGSEKLALVAVAVIVLLGIMLWADQAWLAGGETGDKREHEMLPSLSLKDLSGADVSLDQFKGKVILVNFWATWCGPCLIEIPWMIEFQEKYAARGFTVVGVAMDDEGREAVEPWVTGKTFDVDGRQMKMNYPVLLGNEDAANRFGGLIGLPTTLVVARDGRIVKRIIGLASHDVLVREIEALL